MTITSSDFTDGGLIPPTYSCEGGNSNPPLAFAGVPKDAQSLALLVSDPDSPNGTWQHWLIWSIDPVTTEIAAGQVPIGAIQGTNDFGRAGYGGPCPAVGVHHYVFHLYALDTKLMPAAGANRKTFDAAISGHIIAEAELIGRFGHSKS